MNVFNRIGCASKKFASANCQSCTWKHDGNDAKHHMHKHLARFRGHTVNLVALRVETWGVKTT